MQRLTCSTLHAPGSKDCSYSYLLYMPPRPPGLSLLIHRTDMRDVGTSDTVSDYVCNRKRLETIRVFQTFLTPTNHYLLNIASRFC